MIESVLIVFAIGFGSGVLFSIIIFNWIERHNSRIKDMNDWTKKEPQLPKGK